MAHYQQLEFAMAREFNPELAIIPTTPANRRAQAHDVEGALAYINERVDEMKKKGNYSGWIKNDKKEGQVLMVDLHSMPLYWSVQEIPDKEVTIYNPDGSVRETRPAIYGATKYPLEDEAHGIELLETLASGKNEAMMKILGFASAALKTVDEIELPHIEQKAEMLYNDANHAASLGKWGEPNEMNDKTGRKRISKEKTNKMNQYKQTARRQLGYTRLRPRES